MLGKVGSVGCLLYNMGRFSCHQRGVCDGIASSLLQYAPLLTLPGACADVFCTAFVSEKSSSITKIVVVSRALVCAAWVLAPWVAGGSRALSPTSPDFLYAFGKGLASVQAFLMARAQLKEKGHNELGCNVGAMHSFALALGFALIDLPQSRFFCPRLSAVIGMGFHCARIAAVEVAPPSPSPPPPSDPPTLMDLARQEAVRK